MNNKSINPNQEITDISNFAKALSHPARIEILRYLAERDTCICGEIVDILPLAQSTVSQHLKELKKAGLITGEVDGPRSCYCINREKLSEVQNLLNTFCAGIINKVKGCCR